MSSHWKAVFGIILIFIFGWVSGALCISLFLGHRAADIMKRGPEAVVDLLEKRLTHHLNLDATQKEKIHLLFMQNVMEREELQLQVQPQVQQFNRQTFQQINQILTPEQREIFRENLEVFRKRFGKTALNVSPDNSQAPNVQSTPTTNSAPVGN